MDELEKRNVIPVLSDFDKSISLHELKGVIQLRIIELEEEVKKLSSDAINIPDDWEARVRIDELKKLLGEVPRERADKTVHSEFDVSTKID